MAERPVAELVVAGEGLRADRGVEQGGDLGREGGDATRGGGRLLAHRLQSAGQGGVGPGPPGEGAEAAGGGAWSTTGG